MRALLCLLLGLGPLAAVLSGCPEPAKRGIGDSCSTGNECVSGLCGGELCLDPLADEDGDGLSNAREVALGSNPLLPDSDFDGVNDGDELDDRFDNVDTDGDGTPDVLESAIADADGDCITDQYDSDDAVQSADPSPMIDAVCSTQGVCSGQRAALSVTCATGSAVCVYDAVPGWANPETQCDAVDQNCDGTPDDGFPDRDADGIANCVDDDWDNDGQVDGVDNCPLAANADQADADSDGIGDVCVTNYRLYFVAAPAAATVGIDFAASVGVQQIQGEVDAPSPPFRGTVTLALNANGGATTLTGTASAVAGVDHVARLTGLGVSAPGNGLTLVATSGGLGSAESSPFDANSGALARFSIDELPASVVAGTSNTFTIQALDASDNLIVGYAGSVRITSSDAAASAGGTVLGDGLVTSLGTAPAAVTFFGAGPQTLNVIAVDGTASGVASTVVSHAEFAALDIQIVASSVAGQPATITVTPRDAYGNVVADYDGIVVLTSGDGQAVFTQTSIDFSTLTDGKTWTGEITLQTSGGQTITATAGSVTESTVVTVAPAAATRLDVVPTVVTTPAGVPFAVDLTVRDAFGNVATSFVGDVTLTAVDGAATLSTTYTFTANDLGAHRFTNIVLNEAVTHTITAIGPDAISGSAQVTVEAGGVAALNVVTAPSSGVAGVPFQIAIDLRDAQGNLVVAGPRTIRVVYGDGTTKDVAINTAAATLTGLSLTVADTYNITVTLVGASAADTFSLNIVAAPAARLSMTTATSVVAGVAHSATVTAYDAFDNVATGYRGTLTFGTSDAAGTAPSAYSFGASDAGTTQITGFIGRTAGAATITTSDAANALSTTASVDYTPAVAASLQISALPTSSVAGTTIGLTVTAYDSFNNIATGYRGAVQIVSLDNAATLPSTHTYVAGDNGRFAFTGVILRTAGSQQVTARDTSLSLSHALAVSVQPAAATHFDVVLAANNVPAGVATSAVVTARDAFDNVATGYTGSVEFISGDDQATLPANYTFVASDFGVRTLGNITFRTVGVQSFVATDLANATITGGDNLSVDEGSDVIFVFQNAPTTSPAGAAFTLTLRVEDLFGNLINNYDGTVHFDSDDPQDVMPDDYTFTGSEGGVRAFSGFVLKTSGSKRVTAVDAMDSQLTTNAIIDVTPGSMSALVLACTPTTLNAGQRASCTVRAVDTFDNTATGYRGTVAFTSDDPNATLPAATAFSAGNAGLRTFSSAFGFQLAGSVLVTVTAGAITDNVTFDVLPAGIGALRVAAETATPTAGAPFYVDVSARDEFGNIQTDFNGTVAFVLSTGCDAHTNATLVNGSARVTGFRCTTAGARQIDVSTTGAPAFVGAAGVTVAPAALDHFTLVPATTTPTAGVAFSMVITPRDAFENQPSYSGTMTFTMPSGCDAHATAALNNVTTVTGFRCTTSGAKSLSGVAATKSGSANVTVQAAALDHFTFVASTTTPTAGTSFAISARPRDAFENPVVFSGTMTLPAVTGCDAHANAPIANDTTISGFRCTVAGAKTLTGTAGGKSGAVDVVVGVGALDRFTLVASTATPNAGAAFDVTVQPRDLYGNAVTYSGTMTFTVPSGCDPHATAPVNNDTTVTGFRCTGAGSRDISGAAGGKSGLVSVTVQALPLHHFTFTPSTTVPNAGVVFSIDVKPHDDFDNLVPYTGTMAFTMPAGCDAHANAPISNTTTVSDFRCTVAGTKTISGLATGKSGSTTVNIGASAPDHFTFTPSTTTPVAGVSFSVDVKPRDSFGNTVPYSGTMAFTMPSGCDPRANATISNDTTVTGFRCTVAGAKALSGTSSGVGGTTTVTVGAAALAAFTFTPSTSTPTAGVAFSIAVKPRDAFDNVVAYSGTMTFTTPTGCDTHANASITNDTTVPNFRCTAAGTRAISGLAATKVGSTSVEVAVAALDHFTFVPSTDTPVAGATFKIDVKPRDAFDNVRAYSGTMTFPNVNGCTVPATASISNDTTVDGFSCTLAGDRTIVGNSGGKSGQTTVTVRPGATAKLNVAATPGSVVAGDKAITFTVEAVDASGNRTPSYAGQVTFTVDSGGAKLPANYTFVPATDLGVHVFDSPLSYLELAGTRTLNARDTLTATITDDTPPTVVVTPACLAPSAPSSIEWKTHPAAGKAGETLPTSVVQLKDFAGNVCTNLSGRPIVVRVGTNANEAVLSGTVTISTVAGVSSFSTLKLDQHGVGYTFVASSSGVTAVTSNPFNVTWGAPTFVGTPAVSSTGGCTAIAYTVAQAGGGPVTLAATYSSSIGGGLATPLGTGLGISDGLVNLKTTAAGVAHGFRWDNFVDLGATKTTNTKVTLTATTPDGTSTSIDTTGFIADASWAGQIYHKPVTSGITPGLSSMGDLDRNGLLDVVLPGLNKFVIMFYDRANNIMIEKAFGTDRGNHTVALVTDINDDAVPDLIFNSTGKDELIVAITTIVGAQDLTFAYETVSAPCGSVGVSDMVAADFNHDGAQELAVACAGAKALRFFSRGGTNEYTLLGTVSFDAQPRALALIDWTRDGYPDLVVGTDNAIQVIARNGNGLYGVVDTRATPQVSDVAVGDLNEDGLEDIAFTYKVSGASSVFVDIFWRKGTASLQNGVATEHDLKGRIDSLDIGDIDHDGVNDLVLGSTTRNEVVLASGDFKDPSTPLQRTAFNGGATDIGVSRVFASDITADGRVDMVYTGGLAANPSAGFVESGLSRQCGSAWDAPRPAGTYATPMGRAWSVDINGDGKLDLVQMGASYQEVVSISYGRGDGSYEKTPYEINLDQGANTNETPKMLAFGDFNNDGKLDVLVQQDVDAAGIEGPLRRFHQTSAYSFTEGAKLGNGAEDVVVADFDLDGDDDVGRLNVSGGLSTISILYRAANSTYTAGPTIEVGEYAWALETADLNRDGVSDFIVKRTGRSSDLCTVLSTGNNPPAWPSTVTSCLNTGSGLLKDLQLADLNGDGRKDVVYGAFNTVAMRTLTTAGAWSTLESWSLCNPLRAVAVADVDGLRGLDLVLECNTDGALAGVQVYPQQASLPRFNALDYVGMGRGNFNETNTAPALAAGDFDGGFSDVSFDGLTWRNVVTPLAFEEPSSQVVAAVDVQEPSTLDLVDWDLDGDLDVVTATFFGTKFWLALQSSSGAFSVQSQALTTGNYIEGVALGDFNFDSRPDIAVAFQKNSVTGGPATHHLDFWGRLAGSTAITVPSTTPRVNLSSYVTAMAAGQIGMRLIYNFGAGAVTVYSNDTLDDLVLGVGITGGNAVDLVIQFGDGSFGRYTSGNLMTTVHAVTTGLLQVQNQHRLAAVGGNCAGTACIRMVDLRYNVSPTSITVPTVASLNVSGVTNASVDQLVASDLDNDGDDDLVALVSYNSGASYRLYVFRQSAAGAFTQINTGVDLPGYGYISSMKVADMNGDGRRDVILAVDDNYSTMAAVVFQNPNAATIGFLSDVQFVSSGHDTSFAVPGDMNRDGRPDIVTLESAIQSIRAVFQR